MRWFGKAGPLNFTGPSPHGRHPPAGSAAFFVGTAGGSSFGVVCIRRCQVESTENPAPQKCDVRGSSHCCAGSSVTRNGLRNHSASSGGPAAGARSNGCQKANFGFIQPSLSNGGNSPPPSTRHVRKSSSKCTTRKAHHRTNRFAGLAKLRHVFCLAGPVRSASLAASSGDTLPESKENQF